MHPHIHISQRRMLFLSGVKWELARLIEGVIVKLDLKGSSGQRNGRGWFTGWKNWQVQMS